MGSLSWLLVGLLSLVCMDGSQSMPTDSTPMIYPSQYVIMAPNTIRPGRPLTLSVNILDAVGSVFVEAFVANSGEEVCRQGEPCTGIPSTLRASGSVFANQITPITLQIGDLPPPPGGSYYLQVRGSGGLSFLHTNETLEYKLDSFIILIQTDKAAYKPGQTVRFRTMAVEPDMTPCANATFDIKIKDADGNIIRQWTSVGSNNSGVFSDELVLSSRPVLGLWSIEVTKDRQSKMHEILIDEFVLPRFDVKISNPLAFTDEDTSIAVTVESSFTFGRPLQGTASLEVGLKYSSERFQPIADMELVNGMAVFTITMIDLAPIFTRQFASGGLNLRDGQAFVIHVNVTDELSGRMEGADSIIRYFESPVQVKEHPDNPGVFKPGMNLNLQLVVSRADGEPLTETHLERLSRIVRVTVRSDGDESALAFPINSDGIVPLSIPVSSETNSLSLTVQARYCLSPPPFQANCARFTESTLNIYKTELDSPSGSYLCLEQLTPNLMVGQIAQFRVTTAVDSPMWYQVIAKGNILLTGSLNSVTTQFQFTVTLEMAPCARVIIYYVRDDGEVVPDILEFAVDGTFRHNVRVSLSRSEASPGNPVSVTVTADPNSFVGILAVDKSVQLFRDGNDLSRYDILSSLQSIDTTPINRYPFYGPFFPGVDYGPVFRKKRAVERQFEADTAGDLFDHAGMIVYTDSYVHTNRDDFYYYLFDGPVLALPGVPEVDRDNTGIDTDENEVDSGDESGARVRTEFPETWLWNEHETASDGTVFMTTTVPDTITTWVLSAFGLSTMNGLGLADPAELLTSQNFFISMNLPFSVVRGEQFELRISVFNYFSQPLDATLIFGPTPQYDIMLNDEEFATGFEPPRVLNIPANRGVCASFAVVPRGLGLIDLTVNAISALAADAVTRQLLVEPEGFENLNTSTSVILSETVISVSRTLNVMVASSVEDLVTDSIDARLYFTGDIMGTTMNNLDSLLRLPTGCGEQNMMGFAPDVFILKYLEVAGLANDIIRNKAISFLNTGYQTELTFRHGDCSYSAFGERGKAVPGSTWLTAFVVKSFSQAMQFIEIDLKGLECSIEFLTNQQQPDGSFLELGRIIDRGIEGGVNGKTSLAAYILIALQEALNTGNLTDTTMIVFNAIAKAQTYLKDQRLNVQQDKFTLAISSYALALSDSSEAVNFRMDLDRLANVTQESFRFWTNNTNNNVCEDPSMAEFVRPRFYRPPSIDIEMTAYALLAYISVGDIEQALPIVNWLIEQQLSSGGFGSTQDTVVGIQALAEYAASLPRNGSSSLTITTPDDPGFQRVVTVNQFNALELQEVELPPMIERVQITGSSSGVLVMSLSTYYNTLQPTSPCPAFRYSVDVTDRTFNEIEIRACGRYQGSRPATSMCIMEIGIPSGFTPSRVHLEEAKTFGDELFRDYEMRDRKVVCYFDEIPKDRRVCISFIAERTSSVGNGQMSYATLSDYYKRDEQVTVSYVSPLAQAGGICEFCPKCDCLPACGTIICPAVYEPVCGSDGRTYSNRCNFRAELACRDPDDGLLTILIPDGECPESRCGPNQPCLNGGSCISSICICPLGYEGDLCERVTGPEPGCGSNQPCLNGGTCVFGRCLCLLGYEGDLCERVTGPEPGCGSNQPCLNGGTCIFGRCLCLLGYEGDLCERVTGGGPCQPNPCVNGLCLPNILTGAGYFCLCSEGFQGTNCDQPTVPAGCRDCNLFLGPPCTVEASREFCGTCPIGTRCCDNCCGGQSCLPINPDMCLRTCTQEYNPVCGSDGITYGNLCSFESAQCRNPFLTYTSGECGTDMCLRICTLEYDPVCGSDGITYGNLCSFESAQCRNPFLTYTSGECGTVPCPTITICTLEYAPVCGSDGITYGNLCQFESAQCRNPSLSYTPGECGIDMCLRICTLEYDPVCGSDGITYGNLCSFESAQCRNPFLTYTSGECGTVPCPTITICTLEYEPVCGSDGITYGNLCQFESAQCRNPSLSYTPGECGIVPGVCVDCTLFLPSDCSADARREQCGTCPTGTQCCDNCCGGQSCVPFIPDPCDGISCDGSYIPVCGTDGITYDNFCELGRETCRNPRVLFQSFGECEVDPCDVISCDGSYIPVCGTDGITYDNFCELGRETCRNPRVLFQSFGECEVGNSCFPNPCRNRGSCIPTGTSYICLCQEGFSGENCDIGDCDFACITLFDPVCGSDGVTYSNECELSRATCRDPSIVKRHDGECTTVTPGCVSCAAITMLPCQPGSFNERCGVCPEATHVCCDNCCGGQRCTPRLPQPCASNPCRNGGSCVPNGPFGYECRCPIGYSGVNCESELDVCWDCRLVRVDCNVRPPTETCRSCPNATHECCDNCCGGRTCVRRELGPDPCDSDPCLNGGSCSSRGTEYMCSCPIGIGGYNCEDVGPDIIPPIIFDCIGVVHQYLTNGDFVPVSWEVPGYFDDRGGDVVLQNGPSVNSGFFPEGNFTLSYVYADGAGNRGSCNVDVIVEALDCGNLICNGGGPVCGTDLITYSDICELKRAACYLLTESPSFLYDGPCSDFDPCDFECSDFTRPVCGTDGITYRNPCELARNVCRYPDMALNHIGNCDVFPPVDPCLITSCFNGGSCMPDADGSAWCLCPLQYGGTFCDIFDVDCDPDPCRNGGSCIPLIITYICICPDGFSGDNCERDDCPSIICTLEYDPVCGSDGITYGNLCQFESAQCRNPYLTYTSGECGTVQCPTICTLEYDPVCGSDGTTYGNLCQFESAQCRDPSLTYTYGECGTVQCPTICTLEYAPVCGSDEVTYGNLCQFESAQCRNPSLTYTHGECGTVQCPTICTLEYAPVCGSDGVTYGNLCQFESAQCRNPSLTYTTGECGTVQCPTICTLEYAPVCGSDGVTYGNLCQFESAQCRNPSLTYTTGECGTVQCPTICTLEYAPVCGSDGVTYGNLCQFESAQCRNPSLTYTTGECGTVQCPTICTLEYAPVCGSDGITYGNLCQFESAQCLDPSLTYTTGECGTGNSCFPNPCRNRGSCIPTSTGYFCLCQDGFSGENCDIGDCDFACITLFDPVCGSDGVTYSNECELSRATCRDSSIVKRRDGECTDIGGCIPNPCRNGGSCIPTSTGYLCLCQEGYSGEYCEIGECDFACIALFDPVCGSDGVTYGNECELSRATCRDPSIVKRHDGDCTDIGGCIPNPCRNRGSCIPTSTGYLCLCQEGFSGEYCEIGECDFPCIALFDPVCGSDGVTYGNECELSRGTCRDPSIVKRHDGECTGLCPDGSRPVNCFVDPCQFASCPLYPNATCRANYCGGCIAEWFVRGEQVRCDGLCPDGSRPFNCFADPCEVTSCPLYPNAECRSNFCGGCNAEWFVGGEQVRCDGLCPDGSQPVNCFVDPCQFASCPLYPNAECRSNFCGGCNAEWFVDGEQVSCNVCDFACPAVFAPVCGSDGVTYPNSCDLSRAACRDPTIVQISMGPCTDACSFPCPEIFAPVCGSDGVTYPNSCELSRAACRDPTIIQVSVGSCTVGCASFPCENDGSCVPSADGGSFTCECIFGFSGVLCEILPATGPCANSPCQNGGSCAAIGPNDFVCDCPPNLFGLNCEQENTVIDLTAPILYDCPSMVQGFLTDGTYLRVEWQPPNAIDEREGEVSTSSGPQSNFGFFPQGEFTLSYTLSDASNNQESCSFPVIIEAIDCDNLDCSEFSEPVCGSNDQTYMTECALQSAACTNDGLTVKHRGPCRPDPCDKECPTINRPVCGTDGVTYRNPCELSIETCRSDVDLDHLGICDDACTSEPCLNGGDCQLTAVGTYFCMCPTGYRGRNCEIEGSLCDMPNICQNGGSCTPGGNTGYMCQCAVGFFGTNCEIAIQPCSSDPCLNGGTCVPGNVAFFCLCEEGFVGRVCEIDTNVLNITCPSNDSLTMYPLLNGGQEVLVLWPPIPCVDRTVPGLNLFGSCNETSGATFRPGSTTVGCSCTNPSGNVARCTFTVNIPVPDACASRPCLNGGECRSTPFGNYMCMCRTGFRGQNCEVAFSPLNITCPAASAIDVIATPDGQSAAFWENPTCIEGTGLAPNLFASCNRTIFEVFPPGNTTVGCQCANAAGEFARCTFTVNVPVPDACASRPCFNGGECQSTPFGNYICMCQTGFRGQNCEVAFSPLNITCPAASTVNVISIPSGQSIAIWPNPTCIEGIGLAPNLFASCNRTLGEVFPPGNSTVGCQCTNAAGEVARCTFNVNVPDACDSSPCLNGGECQSVPFGNSYICTCPTGFIGQNCEIAFRPLNITCPAASTVDVIRIPNGQSLAIWPNPTCTEGTGLAPNIVASCDPTLGSIFPPGITTVGCQCTNTAGEVARCTFDVDVPIPDPCASSPCLNGATCLPTMLGDYTCQCAEGFTGLNCDQAVLTITCPASSDVIIIPTPNGQLGIWGPPPCTQGAALPTIFSTCDPPVGILSPGENPVTCTCRSLAGEVASCTFIVDVPVTDPCASSPCLNGATCSPTMLGDYVCQCTEGFTGLNCDQAVLTITCPTSSDVLTFPAQNGQTLGIWGFPPCTQGGAVTPILSSCDPPIGSSFLPGENPVTCSCRSLAGEVASCTFNVDIPGPCASSPCINGGMCLPSGINSYTCDCPAGFFGTNCEQVTGTLDIPCPDTASVQTFPITNGRVVAIWQPIQCVDSARPNLPIFADCIPTTGSIFQPGNTMVDCSCTNAVGDIASCSFVVNGGGQGCASFPCENDGRCIPGADGASFTCECLFGFTGPRCENAPVQTACTPNPCMNGGVCNLVGLTSFSCSCPTAFIGTRCEQEQTACNPNPCQNGGACSLQGISGFSCTCASGFTGVTCGQVQTACNPNPCINGGVCNLVGLNSFSCNCPTAFIGTRCEQERTACNPNPCQNGGACSLQGINGFSCTCASGFTGVTCGQVQTACNPNPCINGGVCNLVGLNSFSCNCPTAFIGTRCEQERTACNPNPCQNGGACSLQGINGFTCTCASGFTGVTCGQELTACNPNPCQNGGACTLVGITVFSCTCVTGFTGVTCGQASVINCPTVGLNFLDSEVITWTEPSVSGGTRVSQTHFPGISEFPLGTTVVMYQFAVPGSTQLLTCAFPVTVTRDPNSAGLVSFPARSIETTQTSSSTTIATLSCTVQPDTAEITWLRNGNVLQSGGRYFFSQNRDTLWIVPVTTADAGPYQCRATVPSENVSSTMDINLVLDGFN